MTLDQVLSQGRTAVSYVLGAASALGFVSYKGVDLSAMGEAFNHIFAGVKEISLGLGPLAALAIALWGSHKASPAAVIATVAAMPEVKKILVSPTAPPESAAAVAAIDHDQPKVGTS